MREFANIRKSVTTTLEISNLTMGLNYTPEKLRIAEAQTNLALCFLYTNLDTAHWVEPNFGDSLSCCIVDL